MRVNNLPPFVCIVDADEFIRDGGEYEASGFCGPGALR